MRLLLASFFAGALGALVGFAASIAYDTSATTSALEGGRAHLTFGAILGFAALGALAGVVVVLSTAE